MTMQKTSRENGILTQHVGFAAARDELLRLTRKRHYAALSTAAPGGQPQSAPMRYCVTDDFEIVMGTLAVSRKYANLERNAKVAVLIWDNEFAIQIEGAFEQPSGNGQDRLRELFTYEFPENARIRSARGSDLGHVYFRIVPSWVRYSDFSEVPGRVLTLDFSARTEKREPWPVVRRNDAQ